MILGTLIFAIFSIEYFLNLDWRLITTYYQFIDRILILVIGFELVKMLIVHKLSTILELLAFVVARKVLLPDLSSVDIGIGVLSFCVLVIVRMKLLRGETD